MMSTVSPQFAGQPLDLPAFFDTPPVSAWEQAASEAMRGAEWDTLIHNSLEGVCYRPLYTVQDLPECLNTQPQAGDQRRSTRLQSGWTVLQAYTDSTELLSVLQADVQQGLERAHLDEVPVRLKELLQSDLALQIQIKQAAQYVDHAQTVNKAQNLCWLWDVWSDWFQSPGPDHLALQQRLQTLKPLLQVSPGQHQLFLSSRLWHEAGASAVQELAVLAASLVDSLQLLSDLEPQIVLDQTCLELSVGPQLFLEVAKYRAARILMQRVAEAYQAHAQGLRWQARTSRRFLSQWDPYNNLLRQTLGALAAVLGGAQALITEPFDILTAAHHPDAHRLARNLQLILKHEVHLDQIVDPAGGSYFIERLTQDLAETAWQQFQQIEAGGGLQAVWAEGSLQQAVAQTAAARQQEVARRQQILVGVNLYTDPTQSAPAVASALPLQPLQPLRLAAPFEALRQYRLQNPLEVHLLPLRSLKQARARLDFAQAFFAVAACRPEITPVQESPEALQQTVLQSQADVLVLCGSDADYADFLQAESPLVSARGLLVLAGPLQDSYRAAGVQQAIFAGCDVLGFFEALP